MASEDTEALYSPSQWSKRLPADLILLDHLKFATPKSEEAHRIIPNQLNIPYGTLEKEKLDIFGTDLPSGSPIFVFFHGGYWQVPSLQRATYHFIAPNLYKKGIKSIFVGYELCPKVLLEEIDSKVGIALEKCLAYAVEHKSRGVFLGGYSAGCQLAANIFAKVASGRSLYKGFELIKGAVLVAGIYNLTPLIHTRFNEPLKLDEPTAVKLSPMKENLEQVEAEFLIIAAQHDSPAFVAQSHEFSAKLKNSSLIVVDDADHFSVIEALADMNEHLTQKIINLLLKA